MIYLGTPWVQTLVSKNVFQRVYIKGSKIQVFGEISEPEADS